MIVETIGHAGLLVRDKSGNPLLLTDPWLLGSCYWRSWWIQNYPSEELLGELRENLRYCYVTHEHPDHFHTPSIRKLGKKPFYLSPHLPHNNIAAYLREQAFQASTIRPFTWFSLDHSTQILSIPLYNDDSVLLINTPNAFVINLNDSKPSASQLKSLEIFLRRNAEGKKRILLSSYSPASIVNNFIRDNQRLSMKSKSVYIHYIQKICAILKADYFMPFASQVIFYRSDTAWANEFKVGFPDMKAAWKAETNLLPPYTRLDLSDMKSLSTDESAYRHDADEIKVKTGKQEIDEALTRLSPEDLASLKRKFNRHRFLFSILFPKGIGIHCGDFSLRYRPVKGSLTIAACNDCNFVLQIPPRALRDALLFGHFGDLGIAMFTMILLNGKTDPRKVYLFFILLTFHDYRHTVSIGNFTRWILYSFRHYRWRIPGIASGKAIPLPA